MRCHSISSLFGHRHCCTIPATPGAGCVGGPTTSTDALHDTATTYIMSELRHEMPIVFPTQSSHIADYTQNPFASTHSLDTNPFDDPPQRPAAASPNAAARLEEIRRREADLERRESELNNRADHIRKHGRNNFPPCSYGIFQSRLLCSHTASCQFSL